MGVNRALDDAQAFGLDTVFDADGDNSAQVIKAGPGMLHLLAVHNPNASTVFIQLFDAAAGDVTVGATEPKLSIPVPPPAETPAGGPLLLLLPRPIKFRTAITYACTTTAAGSGDPSTGLTVNAGYL